MFFIMEVVPEVPFGLRLYRFRTDDNETTLIRVGTPPFTLTLSFASCAMEAKQDWIGALAAIRLRRSNNESPGSTIVFDLDFILSRRK